MDREQEDIQFLSFFDILTESCNIVSSWRKIFSQITLFLIIPLSSLYLAHIQIQEVLFVSKIMKNTEHFLDFDFETQGMSSYNKIFNILASDWTVYFLFKIVYLSIFAILALHSTSAVVYTIACIYTAKDVTLKKVMSVVPNVWKRLVFTFGWSFTIGFFLNLVFLLLLIIRAVLLDISKTLGIIFLVLSLIGYLTGTFYLTILWQLTSVVSILEEICNGLQAIAKSHNLIKGKMGVSVAVFLLLGSCFLGVELMFKMLVVVADGKETRARIVYGIICLVLMSLVMLFGLVAQTVVYFVCKSYHHENIDKSSLAEHLEGYLGEYVPLKTKDIQLEQFEG